MSRIISDFIKSAGAENGYGYFHGNLAIEKQFFYLIRFQLILCRYFIEIRRITGFNLATDKQWWIERQENGKAAIRYGGNADTGKSWIEDDMICDQLENLYENLTDCWVVYRNPEGSPETHDEYIGAPGYGVYPFSIMN
jgi:hypothetical protein